MGGEAGRVDAAAVERWFRGRAEMISEDLKEAFAARCAI